MNETQRDWRVDIQEDGRCGKVIYRELAGSLSCDWEISGGDPVVSIRVGDEREWQQQHAWAVARRAEILQRIAGEVIRQKAQSCHAKMDEQHGWIHIQQGGQRRSTPPPFPDARQKHLRVSEAKGRIMFIAAIVLVVLALILGGAKKILSVSVPHGVPLGESVRAGGEIATLIETLEAYVPSLHRDPSKDRYRLSLLLYPFNGASSGRMIPLARNLTAQEASWAKLLGGDERTVWYRLNEIGGVEVATGARIGPAELRTANPTLAEAWDDPRRISFNQRLQITLLDRSVLEIDPQTLKASPVSRERTASALPRTITAQDFLCAGVLLSPTEWLGLHSTQEAEREYRPKSWMGRANDAPDATAMRRFHRGELGPTLERGRREILSMTPLSGDEFLNAAFVRSGPNEEPLRLAAPDGFLMVFTSAPGLAGTLVVARVNEEGKLAWKVDTGIERFKWTQVLPDTRFIAFIGPRPPVPNRLSEPILVIINTQSGTQSIRSLWK
jgi:hypothetical protein